MDYHTYPFRSEPTGDAFSLIRHRGPISLSLRAVIQLEFPQDDHHAEPRRRRGEAEGQTGAELLSRYPFEDRLST